MTFLDDLGMLDDRLILGHAIYLDHHAWNPLKTSRELTMLAERGVTVAHCPTVFGRTGMTLQTFGRYVRAGVRLGIGTDSFPHNMLEEMRHVGYFARITAGDVHDHTTTDVFDAATVGGADALGRPDLGRLAPGAKADLVLVDVTHPAMRPVREPIRSLIIQAADPRRHRRVRRRDGGGRRRPLPPPGPGRAIRIGGGGPGPRPRAGSVAGCPGARHRRHRADGLPDGVARAPGSAAEAQIQAQILAGSSSARRRARATASGRPHCQ